MRSAHVALVLLLPLAACEGQAKLPCAGADTQTDVKNCGGCGIECPSSHGTAACVAGACGIAACDLGWLDLDPDDPGCETAVASIPAEGFTVAVPSSSTSFRQFAQSDAAHWHEGVLGAPTPLPVGALEQSDGVHRNQPGLTPFLDEP